MGLEARIWALRLGFGPRDWDFGIETGIWASRLRFGGGGLQRRRRKKNSPYVIKHRSSTPLEPLPKKRLVGLIRPFVPAGFVFLRRVSDKWLLSDRCRNDYDAQR